MGHKVHPKLFRLGTTSTWPSRWFARDESYRKLLRQDLSIRAFLKKQLKEGQVSTINIERSRGVVVITIHSGKPGFVIGRSAAGIEDIRKKLLKEFYRGKKVTLRLDVVEVPKANLDATIVVQQVIGDLERRMPFRRVLKMAIERVKKSGALGVKIAVSGRLNGAEIARPEWLGWGKIPLTNLRADIDYASEAARTMAGAIGVKVWIYRGDVFEQDKRSMYQPTTPSRGARGGSDRRGGGYDRRGDDRFRDQSSTTSTGDARSQGVTAPTQA
jgi:small subunit ribosomal protein S3